jgi:hypothetical protein
VTWFLGDQIDAGIIDYNFIHIKPGVRPWPKLDPETGWLGVKHE